MSLHQLSLPPANYENIGTGPPLTLPVMYENERVALAIFGEDKYSFNIPDEIGVRIDFGTVRPSFIYGRTGKGWSRVLSADDELLYIVLEQG